MLVPHHAIEMGTNRYEGDLILNTLIGAQALVFAAVYNQGFSRAGLTPIPSALSSIALVAAEFGAVYGISYLYKHRKIGYTKAVVFSGIAFLFPKVGCVAGLPFSTAISALGCLAPGVVNAGCNALSTHYREKELCQSLAENQLRYCTEAASAARMLETRRLPSIDHNPVV